MNLKQPTLTLMLLILLTLVVFAQIVSTLLQEIVMSALLGQTEGVTAKIEGAGLKPITTTTGECTTYADCPDNLYNGCGLCIEGKCKASSRSLGPGKDCIRDCQCSPALTSGICDKTTKKCLGPCKKGYTQIGMMGLFKENDPGVKLLLEHQCNGNSEQGDKVMEDYYILTQSCFCNCPAETGQPSYNVYLDPPCSNPEYNSDYCETVACKKEIKSWCKDVKPPACEGECPDAAANMFPEDCSERNVGATFMGYTSLCSKCTSCNEKCREKKFVGGWCKEECDTKTEVDIDGNCCRNELQTCCCRKGDCCTALEFDSNLPQPQREPTIHGAKITCYFTCLQSDSYPIYKCGSRYSSFSSCVTVEGSGVRSDGTLVDENHKPKDKHYPPCEGTGYCATPSGCLTAGRSVAVKNTVAGSTGELCGRRIYIAGVGCRVIEDRGGGLEYNQVDMFAGVGKSIGHPDKADIWIC